MKRRTIPLAVALVSSAIGPALAQTTAPPAQTVAPRTQAAPLGRRMAPQQQRAAPPRQLTQQGQPVTPSQVQPVAPGQQSLPPEQNQPMMQQDLQQAPQVVPPVRDADQTLPDPFVRTPQERGVFPPFPQAERGLTFTERQRQMIQVPQGELGQESLGVIERNTQTAREQQNQLGAEQVIGGGTVGGFDGLVGVPNTMLNIDPSPDGISFGEPTDTVPLGGTSLLGTGGTGRETNRSLIRHPAGVTGSGGVVGYYIHEPQRGAEVSELYQASLDAKRDAREADRERKREQKRKPPSKPDVSQPVAARD